MVCKYSFVIRYDVYCKSSISIKYCFSLVGLIGWLIVSLMWNDRALIIINAVGIAIMANGLLGYFMGE